MVGTTISHYEIIEKIGQGGMGEVFLAQDTTLDRKVALKFLPEELQQDPTARKRFLREAKSAAALDHPFICKIYEIGEAQDRTFIAMEYIQGMTLQEKLTGGPLPVADVLETALEVTEALEAAHKNDIVHRDLKPSNIMLTPEGHVKVMDFGLAKRITLKGEEEDISTVLTQEGAAVGTVPYMSPEQVRGRRLDTRSDIFSFGVLLYEMVTGVNPFKKDSVMDTAQTILSLTPPPITRYADDVPDLLQHTVRKLLAKESDQRYQSIHEVRTNLGELSVTSRESEVSAEVAATTPDKRSYLWPGVAGGVMVLVILAFAWLWPFTPAEEAINSIAILPFENATNDPELEYLSDGIADSVISGLSQISDLKVMSSSAVSRYKGTDVDPQLVAEELGVRAVMKGRLLRPGDAFSIRVELVDTQDNTHIWGEQYSPQLDKILSLQEEIAQEISQKLRLQISGEEQAQLAVQGTQNPEAYQAYLKGQYHRNQRTGEGFEKAIESFNQAIEQDPTYARAYAGLAEAYYLQAVYGGTINEAYERELSAAVKALEIDPTLAEAHAAMGLIKGFHDWDWAVGEEHFRRAIELNPNSSRSHHAYANFLMAQRRFDEALSELRKAQVLDPLSAQINSDIGSTFLFKKEYDEAIKQLQTLQEMYPNRGGSGLIRAYWFKGEREEAIAAAERDASLGVVDGQRPVFLRHVLSGNREEAVRAIENWGSPLVPQRRAAMYAMLGDKDRAIELLENGLEEGYASLERANLWPEFDPLRDEPRFQNLLRRMNLEP